MLGKATHTSLAHNNSGFFMDKQQTITKAQVKEIMHKSRNGGEIAEAVKKYFSQNFKKPVLPAVVVNPTPDQLYEFAINLFNPVDNPRAGVGVGQAPALGLGL